MNIVLAGATWATRVTRDALIRNGHKPVVFGQKQSDTIAGWEDLNADVLYDKLNDHAEALGWLEPDVLFVVGSSQLVSPEILRIPKIGCVGFHPTMLPHGRGRAPIAWLILGVTYGAATFFELTHSVDAGPIFAQVPFSVNKTDYAQDVCDRISFAMDAALDEWLPNLTDWRSLPQDETKAAYLGVRRPEDGRISWGWSADEIQRLVRAASEPYPGAFSGEHRIWRASVISLPHFGVPGRVLGFDGDAPFVQTGYGLLRLDRYDGPRLRVGQHL